MYLVYILEDKNSNSYYVGMTSRRVNDCLSLIKTLRNEKYKKVGYKATEFKDFTFVPQYDCVDKEDAIKIKQELINTYEEGKTCINTRNSIRKKRKVLYSKANYIKNKDKILANMKKRYENKKLNEKNFIAVN